MMKKKKYFQLENIICRTPNYKNCSQIFAVSIYIYTSVPYHSISGNSKLLLICIRYTLYEHIYIYIYISDCLTRDGYLSIQWNFTLEHTEKIL